MSEDYYRILGVDRDASTKEIKRAYRKQAAQYHPDVSDAANAEERFKQIKKAKEVLTDPDERARYDQLGHDQYEQAAKHGATGAGGSDGFGGMGGFGDIFEQFFGGGERRNGPRRGQHIRTSVSLDLEEAYSGARKRISITRPERCPECDGRGYPADAQVRTCPQCQGSGQERIVQNTPFGRIQQTQTCRRCEGAGETYSEICHRCDGSGVSREQARLTVEIPAGIESGQTLRMQGEGAPGSSGGSQGDLLIDVEVAEHPVFQRDGDDLHRQVPISFPQAVFGATIDVETLDEPRSLEVPPGTQSGERKRLRGAGMPRMRRGGHGDLIAHIQVVTPESLSPEEREALEAFAAAGGEEIDVSEGLFEKLRRSL